MARLLPAILALRRDPRILKLPPYLSLLCILVGIAWLLVLPLEEYSRNTYISENALLPAQVHTYFGGSEHTVFRAYRHEVAELGSKSNGEVAASFARIFEAQGLKVGRQRYRYEAAGRVIEGENVYGILQGPRADATEALVLMAAWVNMENWLNQSAVALVLTMARYMKRWSLWSKDIIFLITSDSTAGPQAWVDAYHETHGPMVESLPVKAGALQGAIALDYTAGTGGHRFDKLHVHYDGINGQLPNLDLINTVIKIANDQVNIHSIIQGVYHPSSNYQTQLEMLSSGIISQGKGLATGPHSCFIPYHVDAITIQTVGDGHHDEMSLGRVVESSIRSLNNLLEHLHQSFFFYLLLQPRRFVSIGTYLPAAMLIAVNFSITAIALWVLSGRSETSQNPIVHESMDAKVGEKEIVIQSGDNATRDPRKVLQIQERKMFAPVAFIAITYALGLVPLYMFLSMTDQSKIVSIVSYLAAGSFLTPVLFAFLLSSLTSQELRLIQSFSLLITGIVLATLSTLNFSLGLLVGLACTPLSFVRPLYNRPKLSALCASVLQISSPLVMLLLAIAIPNGVWTRGWPAFEAKLKDVVIAGVIGWHVNGVWTLGVVCLIWWPSWLIAVTIAAIGVFKKSTSGSLAPTK